MKYEILPHTAELRFRIYGKTTEELFINAAEAMADILNRDAKSTRIHANDAKKEIIKIQSVDVNSLLVDFLNEILAKSQINKCIYNVSSFKLHESGLEAEIISHPIKRFDEDIKAVTYQDIDIKKINPPAGGWQTDLVFDI